LGGLLLAGLVQCGKSSSDSPSSDATAGTETGGAGGAPVIGRAGSAVIGDAGDASVGVGQCSTPTSAGYKPQWMPPKAAPGACTQQQIEQEYSLCERDSLDYSPAKCRAFDEDAANGACLGCLFSANGDASSGAILLMPGNGWLPNYGGCEALLDGDSSPTSCGARTQAASVCRDWSCRKACVGPVPDADWRACNVAARVVACFDYFDQDTCAGLPRYARCNQASFHDNFMAMGDVFCGFGPPSVSNGEAGAGGAAP